MNPETLIKAIDTGYDRFLTQDRSPRTKPNNCYASQYSPCTRKHVLSFRHGDDLPEFSTDTLARFKRGEDRERDLTIALQRIGQFSDPQFQIIGAQERVEIKDGETAIITGKMDSMIQIGRDKYPIEIKSWSPNVTGRINTVWDMLGSVWTLKAVYQLSTYIVAKCAPFGLFALDTPGKPKFIPVFADFAEGCFQEYYKVAAEAMNYKAAGTLPDFIDDPIECKHCDYYGSFCNPPTMTDPAVILSDEELQADLDRYLEIREVGEEFEALEKTVKARLMGVETGICGSALVTGKWSNFTRYDIPELVKGQIDELKKPYAVKDPKGAFRLKIERI